MNAKRIFAAAAFAIVTAACGGGSGPTLADNSDANPGGFKLPQAPPTDTTGFMPEP
jgi:hypothetical protein